jgi:nucleotide-binding universal stress UspA family protein
VQIKLSSGTPDDVLIETGQQLLARLIVVGAHGQQRASGRHIGIHSERVAQRSGVPVLVVREAKPFRAWASDQASLKIVLGAELSLSTDSAIAQVEQLRALGPCEVSAVRLFWPPTEFQRLGFSGARSYLEIDPAVTNVLSDEVRERLPADGSGYKLRVEPHLGSLGERLASIAEQDHADLIVIGSHERNVVERIWEGSVSHATLHHAHTAVLCVPFDDSHSHAQASLRPRARRILAVTDFSRLGNAAIPLGSAVAEPFATVHVAHVVSARERTPLDFHDIFALDNPALPSAQRDDVLRRLKSLVPQVATEHNQRTQLHVLESDNHAEAIAQAAERLRVDLVVIGTHGRSGISKVLLGSVAASLLSLTKRPVLLAREPQL